MAEVSLMVDAEDGFGNAENVARTVREMESAGVSGVEIEDNFVPKQFNVSDPGLISKEEHVGKLEAAVAARTDPSTVIVARSASLGLCPLEEAVDRIAAYSQTGAEAIMLTGASSREQLQAAHQATTLPICVLSPPAAIRNDGEFLVANGVKLLMLGNPTFAIAVKAIHDSLRHLKDGALLEDLSPAQAPPDLLRLVNRTDEFIGLQQKYLRS